MTTTVRNFLLFMVVNLTICAAVFLFACDFFSQYDATALSTNAYNVNETKIVRVHLVDKDRNFFQRDWKIDMVQKAELPVHPDPTTPAVNPAGPRVRKSRFTLYYRISFSDDVTVVPTTTPYALAMMIFAGIFLLFLRNMYISGNPLYIQKRPRKKLKTLAPQGQPAKLKKSGKKGPPPSPKQKGRGRRR